MKEYILVGIDSLSVMTTVILIIILFKKLIIKLHILRQHKETDTEKSGFFESLTLTVVTNFVHILFTFIGSVQFFIMANIKINSDIFVSALISKSALFLTMFISVFRYSGYKLNDFSIDKFFKK